MIKISTILKLLGVERTDHHSALGEWDYLICRIDCDNAHQSFASCFDDFISRKEHNVLFVLCSPRPEDYHRAFLTRCWSTADDKLKEFNSSLAWYGALPWKPSDPPTKLFKASSDLEDFCGKTNVKSIADWLADRYHGISFCVNIQDTAWRQRHVENLSGLIKAIDDSCESDRDSLRPCVVFLIVQEKGKKNVTTEIESILRDCRRSCSWRIDDFPPIRVGDIEDWYNAMTNNRNFAHIVSQLSRVELIHNVFSQHDGARPLELPVWETFHRVELFIEEKMQNKRLLRRQRFGNQR